MNTLQSKNIVVSGNGKEKVKETINKISESKKYTSLNKMYTNQWLAKQIYACELSFQYTYLAALCIGPIISIFFDTENKYRFGPNSEGNNFGLTVSESFTGNWSKPIGVIVLVATFVQLNAIATFRNQFHKKLAMILVMKKKATEEEGQVLWQYSVYQRMWFVWCFFWWRMLSNL